MLEKICSYQDVTTLRHCRLISKNWNEDAGRVLKKKNLNIKWNGRSLAKRGEILSIISKTEFPQLFSNSSVSTGYLLQKSLLLFHKHGDIISSLHLTFKPAMTPTESNQALGNIWLLLTKRCKNLKILKLEVPLKSSSNLEQCTTHFYLNQEYITGTEMPVGLKEIYVFGAFLLQFPDILFQMLKFAKNYVVVCVKPNISRKRLPQVYIEYLSLAYDIFQELSQRIAPFNGAIVFENY
jgi:hypothetical protein